jgi:hypothetical protein
MYWLEHTSINGVPAISVKNAIYSKRLPIDIAVDAVKRITERYPPPYTLFASGGVDSQACIYAWIKSGVEFKVVFVKYENDFNEHDFTELQAFKKEYNFDLSILNFNVIPFLTTDLEKYVLQYNCISPMICTHFAMSEMINHGTVIFSGSANGSFMSNLPLVETSWVNYTKLSNRNIIGNFFGIEDPELTFAFVDTYHRIHEQIENDPNTDKSFGMHGRIMYQYQIKCLTYQRCGFPVIPQEIKLTGFEKIKDYCDIHFPITPRERLIYMGNYRSKRAFEIKFRYPWIAKVNSRDIKLIY